MTVGFDRIEQCCEVVAVVTDRKVVRLIDDDHLERVEAELISSGQLIESSRSSHHHVECFAQPGSLRIDGSELGNERAPESRFVGPPCCRPDRMNGLQQCVAPLFVWCNHYSNRTVAGVAVAHQLGHDRSDGDRPPGSGWCLDQHIGFIENGRYQFLLEGGGGGIPRRPELVDEGGRQTEVAPARRSLGRRSITGVGPNRCIFSHRSSPRHSRRPISVTSSRPRTDEHILADFPLSRTSYEEMGRASVAKLDCEPGCIKIHLNVYSTGEWFF